MRTNTDTWPRYNGGIDIAFRIERKNGVAASSYFYYLTRGEAKRLAKQIKDALKNQNQKRESA